MADEPMLAQVLGRARHAGGAPGISVTAQVTNRDDANALGDELRGTHLADPHGDVHALGLHVDVAIVEAALRVKFRDSAA
jgi:hypothetical protein